MIKFHAQKGTEQESNIQSLLSHWTAHKKQEGLERSVFERRRRNSKKVKLCKKEGYIIRKILNFDHWGLNHLNPTGHEDMLDNICLC